MVRNLFLLCFISLIVTAYSQPIQKAFSFSGTIPNAADGLIYLNYLNADGNYITDSATLSKGKFSFTGAINGPVEASLKNSEALKDRSVDHPNYTTLFLEPGKMTGVFTADNFKKSRITGSVSEADYVVYKNQISNLDKKWKAVLDSFQAYRNGIDKEKNVKVFDYGMPAYRESTTQMRRQFIRSHPASHISAYLMVYEKLNMPLDSTKSYFNHLSEAVQHGEIGTSIAAFITKEDKIGIGKPAPDFMQPDSSGNAVWLHDFKGKYVLLDVWASWCVPCREEHPYLKQAYNKYKTKGFEILSVSIDREQDKEKWLTAIQKDGLSWQQVCDFKVFQNPVINDYNLVGKGIPRNFLIDPQGKIVAMNLRGDAVEKKLSELFNQ